MEKHSNAGTVLKFIFFSLLGIFVFFVPIRVNSSVGIPIDHLIALLKKALSPFYQYIILVLSAYSVIFKIKKRKFANGSDILFFIMAVLGFFVCLAAILKIGPEWLLKNADSSITATGNIVCAICLSAIFVPFLVEYGLVDAVGVIFRPVMRKLFKTPGSSAVIGVSAFLGNYSTGHVVAKQLYDDGRYTEKESFIVATGFSTCSIGLMLNLANYLDIMQHWGLYVISVVIVTFITTIITARTFPASRRAETGISGEKPADEEYKGIGSLPKQAISAGLDRARLAPSPYRAVFSILGRVYPIISEIAGTSAFVIACGILIATNTRIFTALGFIAYPVLSITGAAKAEIFTAMNAIGASILEPVTAGVVCGGQELSPVVKWVVAVVPYSAIVFFAGFIPSILSSGIKVKIYELIIIWLERVLIGTILAAVIAVILF